MILKIILPFLLLIYCNSICAQQYVLQPLEVSPTANEIGKVLQNNNLLCYTAYNMLFNNIGDTAILINADTCFNEFVLLDINTQAKKKIVLKSTLDTIKYSLTKTPFFNNYNQKYYFITCNAPNIVEKNSTVRTQELYVTAIDSNFKNTVSVKLQHLPFYGSYEISNKLYHIDSFVYALYNDTFNHFTFTSLNLIDGSVKDTVSLINKFPNSGYISLDWLNDSIVVILSDFIHYINVRTMTIQDTVSVYWVNPLSEYVTPLTLKFNITDSSYIFNGDPNLTIPKYYYEKIKANGSIVKLFNFPVYDSLGASFPSTIGPNYNCWDYYSLDNIYTSLMAYPFTDDVIIGHSNINGITDWIKIFPANIGKKVGLVTLKALNDGSVFAVVMTNENDTSFGKYDAYYITLDKYGNQTSYPLGNTDIKPTTIAPIIYPNPCTNKIIIGNINLQDIKSISILNTLGQFVKNMNASLILDLADLKTGNYILQIKTTSDISAKQFLKE
jgi:Secretion system C-terminal sorting domain